MRKLPFCVYILKSQKDGLLYIGFTTDLHRRLTEHMHGQSDATAPRRPFDLIYCEYHVSKIDALRREGYFKTTAGKKALKLMLRDSLIAEADAAAECA
jgi:putative endonuclease